MYVDYTDFDFPSGIVERWERAAEPKPPPPPTKRGIYEDRLRDGPQWTSEMHATKARELPREVEETLALTIEPNLRLLTLHVPRASVHTLLGQDS